MAADLEDLKSRLVVGHKRDGRSVYDEAAKAELVELCLQPGVSVARLARECGVNANQVSRWLRERGQQRKRAAVSRSVQVAPPFVEVPVRSVPAERATLEVDEACNMKLQARLPNGITVELCSVGLHQLAEVLQTLGRLTCSVSTNI